MKLTNQEIAAHLLQIAATLEMNADNPYRIRAYRRAARTVEKHSQSINDLLLNQFDLTTLPFIGKGIASHIKEIITHGGIDHSFQIKIRQKKFHNELRDIEGLGVKRVRMLNELNIHNKNDLIQAIKTKQLPKIFSEKLQEKILHSIAHPRYQEKVIRYKTAELIVEHFIKKIKLIEGVKDVICTGRYRRRAETVGDTEILVISVEPQIVLNSFIHFTEVYELITIEDMSATVVLNAGIRMKLTVVSKKELVFTLLEKTGSADHYEELIKIADKKNIDIKTLNANNETEVYAKLGLLYIEPELRENLGEIAASELHQLPKLITQEEIKGDLHVHTNETDGAEDLETMVQAAINKGYQYVSITDHSKHLAITHGMDETRLLKQIEQINKLNSQLKNFVILKSIEVDILEDGTLDLSNDVLKELDVRVCSIHSKFKLSEKEQTERIIRAMDNPYFNILGHATGRLINSREPYLINLEKILLAAKERGCFIELNAQPSRLDIKDIYCYMAKSFDVKVVISSDAHSVPELAYLKFGVFQARRGWLEAKDVVNTRNVDELKKMMRR